MKMFCKHTYKFVYETFLYVNSCTHSDDVKL